MPALQQVNARIAMLEALKIDRSIEFRAFSFLSDVAVPITCDKPKKALTVVLGFMIGGLLGVLAVLLRTAFTPK